MQRFTQLVHQYRDRVYSFAYYYLGNAADAEDVAQDVLIRLWQNHKTLDPDRLSGWVMHVTRNACIDAYRKRRTFRRAVEVDSEHFAFQYAAGSEPSPERDLETTEFHEQLEVALQQLPEPHRSIVILRELQDLKYDQISETLDLPLNTVKVYLHRGRHMLREALRTILTHDLEQSRP